MLKTFKALPKSAERSRVAQTRKRRFRVGYGLPSIHIVRVGIRAGTVSEAEAIAQKAFDQGKSGTASGDD